MPRASKKPVNEAVVDELQDNFSQLISSLASSRDIQHFFETFLTTEEKIMLTKRLMLHLMLERGYTAIEIASVLHLSAETVRTHRFISKKGDDVYKEIIAKLVTKRKTADFWKNVERMLKPIELVLQAKSNMKVRGKLLSGDYD